CPRSGYRREEAWLPWPPPSGHVRDADRIGRKAAAVAVLLYVLGVVRHHPREAQHLPGDLVLVAAVDRVGEHAFHHVLIEHAEERPPRQPAFERDLAGLQGLEERFLLLGRAFVEGLAKGLAAIGVRARDRGAVERGRRQRQLIALVGRALAPQALHIKPVALARGAGGRAVDINGDANLGAARRQLVGRDHVIDHRLDERHLLRLEIDIAGGLRRSGRWLCGLRRRLCARWHGRR